VSLVIIDEASMMTLEMLAGILNRAKPTCRVVLLGDPNQLLSVGSGNVLPDLLTLGVPHIRLKSNHRQDADALALLQNVTGFTRIRSVSSMHFDESFALQELPQQDLKDALVAEAAQRYLRGECVQVLAPCNRSGVCSVQSLNLAIRQLVNPADPGKMELSASELTFRDGDRVLIRQNDRERSCSNGDVGILHITSDNADTPEYFVELPDGRRPSWNDLDGLRRLSLAYAITIHKSQGSEFDTILLPVMRNFARMLSRNLLYTSISRAKKRVILFGDRSALDAALRRPVQDRRTMLVSKVMTRMMEVCA
jgi:exodeoxyribonuclease V alpha subunit